MNRCPRCHLTVGNQSLRCANGHEQPPPERPSYLTQARATPSVPAPPVAIVQASRHAATSRSPARRGAMATTAVLLIVVLLFVFAEPLGLVSVPSRPGSQAVDSGSGQVADADDRTVEDRGGGDTSRPSRLTLAEGLPDDDADGVLELSDEVAEQVAAGMSASRVTSLVEGWVSNAPLEGVADVTAKGLCLAVELEDGWWHIPELGQGATLVEGDCPAEA